MRVSDEAGPVTTSLSIGDPYVMPCSLELILDAERRCHGVTGPLVWMLGWDGGRMPPHAFASMDLDAVAADRWSRASRMQVPTGHGGMRSVWVSCEPRIRGGWTLTLTDDGPVVSD